MGGLEAVTALAGAIIGYALRIAEGWLQERRAAGRDREARRREFQRDTLIELQDVMADVVRAVGAAHHEDSTAFKKTGKWGETLLSKEVDDLDFQSRRRMGILRERVLDDELRQAVDELSAAAVATTVPIPRSEDDAVDKLLALAEVQERANRRLGVILRALY